MSIELKMGAEDTLKEKLHDIALDYYKQIYKSGIHAPVKKGRFEAAKDISLMFLSLEDVEEVIEDAKDEARNGR